MGGGGRSLHEKVQSHNLNPCVLQTASRYNSSAKELSVLFSFFYPTVSSLQHNPNFKILLSHALAARARNPSVNMR
jgi:hypothetical protein